MSTHTATLEVATIGQQCTLLHLPAVAAQCAQLAEQAIRERRTHLGYLEALLQAELEEREQRLVERRIREAHLPRMKTLEEFNFSQCPRVSAQQLHELAHGHYIGRAEPASLSATAIQRHNAHLAMCPILLGLAVLPERFAEAFGAALLFLRPLSPVHLPAVRD